MKRKQHKVNEQFERNKIIYEIMESESCKDCALYNKEENHCTDNGIFEPCGHIARYDHKNIIFKIIGETEN